MIERCLEPKSSGVQRKTEEKNGLLLESFISLPPKGVKTVVKDTN